jgi:hypothetical protein
MKPGGADSADKTRQTGGLSKALASWPPLESHLALLTGGPRLAVPAADAARRWTGTTNCCVARCRACSRERSATNAVSENKPDYVSALRVKL